MTDIFISYSRSDHAWVAKLAKALTNEGYSVWWDTRLLAGEDFHRVIPSELEKARCVIVVWSKVSVEREWVRAEAYRANERKVLVPVMLESVRVPLPFNILHGENMLGWDGAANHPAFQRLLQGIDKHCPRPPSGANDGLLKYAKPQAVFTPPASKPFNFSFWVSSLVAVLALAGFVYGKFHAPAEPVPVPVVEPAKSVAPAPTVKIEPTITPPPKLEPANPNPNPNPNLISDRYLNNGDGTITDTKTKLMWKRCAEGQSGDDCSGGKAAEYTWGDAMAKFGKGEWRLPTKDELKSLVYCSNGTATPLPDQENCGKDGTYQRPTIDQKAFPNTGETAWFWSSSPVAGSGDFAWIVGFGNGGDYWYVKKGYSYQVRLVRSGQ